MTTTTTTPREATITPTGARRQQAVGRGLEEITMSIRQLSGTSTNMTIARAIRNRYARAIGAPAGASGDAVIRFLMSADAARLSIEEIDARFYGWN